MLLKNSAGGIIVLGHGGKIELDNTLEERLKLLETQSLPKIRASIFGYFPPWNNLTSGNPHPGNFSTRPWPI
jgi:hypothetical protein